MNFPNATRPFMLFVWMLGLGASPGIGQPNGGKWKVESTRSPMNDAPGLTLTLRAVGPIPGAIGQPATPTLVIRCNEGTLTAYVSVDRVLDDRRAVRLRYDRETAFLDEGWRRSSDYTALFAPDPDEFIRGPLASSDTFRIEVRPYDAAPIAVAFAPRGLAQHLPRIEQVCPPDPVDSTKVQRDGASTFIKSKFDSLAALIERYKTVSTANGGRGNRNTSTTTTSLVPAIDGHCRADLVSVITAGGREVSRSVADLVFSELHPVPRIEEQTVGSAIMQSVRLRSGDGSKSIGVRGPAGSKVAGSVARAAVGILLDKSGSRRPGGSAGSVNSGPAQTVSFVDVPAPSPLAAQEIAGALTEVIAACQTGRQADRAESVFLRPEKTATAHPDNAAPAYPNALRAANIEGSVVAKFVVDTSGRVELTSVEVLKSDHPLFTKAVLEHLPALRFEPAEIDGKKVKQLVQMPFAFSLTR